MKGVLAAVILIGIITSFTAVLGGCTDSSTAERALQNLGMTNIQTQGYSMWGCGEGDVFHTRFAARNPQGRVVTGVVCSGWFKGSTVRFD
jgi:hypothetical protein